MIQHLERLKAALMVRIHRIGCDIWLRENIAGQYARPLTAPGPFHVESLVMHPPRTPDFVSIADADTKRAFVNGHPEVVV